jgi:hypothetical protein
MEPKGFMGYPKWDSASELSSFGHEQCPFDNFLGNRLSINGSNYLTIMMFSHVFNHNNNCLWPCLA